jgi:hypothetical protein
MMLTNNFNCYKNRSLFFVSDCLKTTNKKTVHNCTSFDLDSHLLSLDQSAARTRIVFFLLLLTLIHTKVSSLSPLSTRALSLFLSQFSLVDAAGGRQRRVLRSTGLRSRSFHGQGRDAAVDDGGAAVDGGLRRVEIGLQRRACRPAMRILLLDLRWRGSSSTVTARVIAYSGVDAWCL